METGAQKRPRAGCTARGLVVTVQWAAKPGSSPGHTRFSTAQGVSSCTDLAPTCLIRSSCWVDGGLGCLWKGTSWNPGWRRREWGGTGACWGPGSLLGASPPLSRHQWNSHEVASRTVGNTVPGHLWPSVSPPVRVGWREVVLAVPPSFDIP